MYNLKHVKVNEKKNLMVYIHDTSDPLINCFISYNFNNYQIKVLYGDKILTNYNFSLYLPTYLFNNS